MATKAEVIQRVGEDLGLVPVGQGLESQDQNRLAAAYTEAYERVKEKGLATWAAAGPVPNKLVPSFCLLMCSKLLTSYSLPESRYIRITNDAGPDGMTALSNLAGLAVQEYESTSDAADF